MMRFPPLGAAPLVSSSNTRVCDTRTLLRADGLVLGRGGHLRGSCDTFNVLNLHMICQRPPTSG